MEQGGKLTGGKPNPTLDGTVKHFVEQGGKLTGGIPNPTLDGTVKHFVEQGGKLRRKTYCNHTFDGIVSVSWSRERS